MQTIRVHDPARRPVNWTDVIKPGQFAAFAKDLQAGTPCDADGNVFADPAAGSCLVFDSLDEARGFCEQAVIRVERVMFEVFDSEGRVHSPLLSIVHSRYAAEQETHPRVLRRRRRIAQLLIGAGIPLLLLAWSMNDGGHAIFPAFVGLNMILAAGRLLWFNFAVGEAERARRRRVDAI